MAADIISAIRLGRSGKCHLYVNGVLRLTCTRDALLRYGVTVGVPLTDSLATDLELAGRKELLRKKLYDYVMYKQRTERQVRDKCRLLEATPAETDDLVTWLVSFQLLNDHDYARRFVAAALTVKPMSIPSIRTRLRSKGIAKDVIEEALREQAPPYAVSHSTELALRKMLRSLTGSAPDRERLIRRLMQRGFSFADIQHAIVRVLDEHDSGDGETPR